MLHMAHRVGLDPSGPVLLWTSLEPSRLLCSILDSSEANWKGLDLIGHKVLKYSFIELWVYVSRAPDPSTLRFLQCAQCDIIGSTLFGIVLTGGEHMDLMLLRNSIAWIMFIQ